jgi:hypothetical protein
LTAPLHDATTEPDGTAVQEFTGHLIDVAGRLPSPLALARATGGIYAENLAGMSIDRALEAAGLDFTAVKAGPLTVPYRGDQVGGLDRMTGIVASWPEDSPKPPVLLGAVGTRYPIVQPAAAGEFGQALLDEAGATVVAVCAYGAPRGSRMVLALKLPNGLLVGNVDPYDLYLFVGNSFNSDSSLWGCVAPIRLHCVNQAAATFGRLANRFRLRHTGDIASKVEDARNTLRITGTFAQLYRQAAEEMLSTPMSPVEVKAFVDTLFPTPPGVKSARGSDRWDMRRVAVAQLINHGEHNTVGRGTRYAACQGVFECLDWRAASKTPAGRYERLVTGGSVERLKVRAVRMLA